MKVSVSTNIDQVFAQIDAFVAKAQEVAVPRAINKLRDQAQTAGLREVSRVYGVGPRTMERYLTFKLANARDLEASITVKGTGFPLYAFNPRPTKTGVSVSIKGRRVIIPHAFIKRMPNGHVGVFARGAYGGKSKKFVATGQSFGRFLFSRTRLSINELFTMTPAAAFANERVVDAMNDRVQEQAAKVIANEVRYATRSV